MGFSICLLILHKLMHPSCTGAICFTNRNINYDFNHTCPPYSDLWTCIFLSFRFARFSHRNSLIVAAESQRDSKIPHSLCTIILKKKLLALLKMVIRSRIEWKSIWRWRSVTQKTWGTCSWLIICQETGSVFVATHWLASAVPGVQTPGRRWHGCCRWGCPPWLSHWHTLRGEKKRGGGDEGRSATLRHIKIGYRGEEKRKLKMKQKRMGLPTDVEAGVWSLVKTALLWTCPAAAAAAAEEWNTAPRCSHQYEQNCSSHR